MVEHGWGDGFNPLLQPFDRMFLAQERAIAQYAIVSDNEGRGGDGDESASVSGIWLEASARATGLGMDSAAGGSGRGDSILVFMGFDLGFHSEAHRPEAETQLGRADAEAPTWFVALAEEQLALIADHRFHGFPFVCGL